MTKRLTIHVLENIPLIAPGDDLSVIITHALAKSELELMSGDILVLAQKIVSKAENRFVDLQTITAGEKALNLAQSIDKDPRLVEVILSECRSIIRQAPGVLITEHHRGWIMANAGIDASNVAADADGEIVLLLPKDPDQSCSELREQLRTLTGVEVGIIINDSFGRPFRLGTAGIAIGAAGLPSLWDRRGETDLFGRELKVSQQAIADELAAAASLLQGQGAEGQPVVLIRGLDFGNIGLAPARPAADLIRDKQEDLFR